MQLPTSIPFHRSSVCLVLTLFLGAPAAWAVGFGNESVQVGEDQRSVLLTVWRQGRDETPFILDWATMDETAVAGQDYVASSGTFQFGEGQQSQNLEITLLNDALREETESFLVQLSNLQYSSSGVGLGLGEDATIHVYVGDNDPGVGIFPAVRDVSEAATVVTLFVERGSDNQTPFTVEYVTVDGTATAGQDYVPEAGILEFGQGECCQTIEVEILNDALFEFTEVLRVQLANVSEGHSLGVPIHANIRIEDNDFGVGFAPNRYVVSEDGGVALLTVMRQSGTRLDGRRPGRLPYRWLPLRSYKPWPRPHEWN